MRQIILFITTSLDGYIARPNGEIDWLLTDQDYGYTEFLASVDTVLMGRKTFEQVLTFEGGYPYPDKKNYVFSSQAQFNPAPHATLIHENARAFVEQLRQSEGANIWLVGGAGLVHFFLTHQFLDEIRLFIHPLLLGSGISLFGALPTTSLYLIESKSYDSGMVEMRYHLPR
jgi:dihydrofolate reductase